ALLNVAVALGVGSLTPALALRFATGLCMAGAYPPAMKIVATWLRSGRGLAIGILVGALTLGSAAPHFFRSLSDLPWRATLLAASGLSLLAALILWLLVTEGPDRFPPARFDLHMAGAVFRERGPRLACFGYFGHMWELYAMWAWLGLFLSASLDAHGGGSYLGLNAPAATFVTMGAGGALGAYAGGALADRWGRTALTMAAMTLSGLIPATIRLTLGGPPAVTFFLALLWGITVIADSAQFSTAVTELCPPAYVGTAPGATCKSCGGTAFRKDNAIVDVWFESGVSWYAVCAP